ncbi:hypothetical protein C8J56DRAFT_1053540 [Mycena floridula]|nr:hypothetical protein C8J56DRAFT_1053540 [Mycena floridula]
MFDPETFTREDFGGVFSCCPITEANAENFLHAYEGSALCGHPENYGKIHVSKILLCKAQSTTEEHEFIIATIETSPGVHPATRRYMIAERHSGENLTAEQIRELAEADEREKVERKEIDEEQVAGKSSHISRLSQSSTSSSSSSSSSASSPSSKPKQAHDGIQIFCTRREVDAALDNRYPAAGKSDKGWSVLGELTFKRGSTLFTLEQFLVLQIAITETSPAYSLIEAQCYWYANSIWDVVQLVRAESFDLTEFKDFGRRGRCSVIPVGRKFGTGWTVAPERKPKAIKTRFERKLRELDGRIHAKAVEIRAKAAEVDNLKKTAAEEKQRGDDLAQQLAALQKAHAATSASMSAQ